MVGTGFGCRVHVPALRAAGFDVLALVGRDRDRTARRAQRAGVARALTDLDTALALPGVDVITVATPPPSHAPVATRALDAGIHVLCEKPFTMDAREARALCERAARARRIGWVHHEFRWAEDRATVGRAIAEGRIGEPRVATFVQYAPLLADPEARAPGWWFERTAGGGWLGASGSHAVDQVRTWLGEIASVSATLAVAARRGSTAEDTFTVRARTVDGVDVVLQQTAAAWGPYAGVTRVAGSDGTVWIDGHGVWLADRAGTHQLEVPTDLRLPPRAPAADDPRERFTHLELGPATRLYEALLAALRGRTVSGGVPVPTFADGLAGMAVLDAIRASAAAGGRTVAVEVV